MFWFVAITISLLVAAAVCWPLLHSGGLMRSAGLSLVALGVVLSLLLYREVGTPAAIGVDGRPAARSEVANHAPDQVQMGQMLEQLEQRLQENPDDLEGWLILGRSYKTMQRYPEALAALESAYSLSPENPVVMVELAEASMFASGNPSIGVQQRSLLEQAVATDPQNQKGLWLLGIAAAQTGDSERAADYWKRLLAQMEPGSSAAVAIQEQIDSLSGVTAIEAPPETWPGFDITINAPGGDFQAVPGSVLFVIARRPGAAGPPLGVRRIESPVFPVRVVLTDADSMLPQLPVSSSEKVELLARLSATGQAVPSEGDIQSAAVQRPPTDSAPIILELRSD